MSVIRLARRPPVQDSAVASFFPLLQELFYHQGLQRFHIYAVDEFSQPVPDFLNDRGHTFRLPAVRPPPSP